MTFKMKGHTLPGIKQLKSNDLEDGKAGSAAFQQSDIFGGSSKDNDIEWKKAHEFEHPPQPPIHEFHHQTLGELKKKAEEKSSGGPFDKSVFKDRKTSNGYEQRSVDKHNADWVRDPRTGEYYHANEGK